MKGLLENILKEELVPSKHKTPGGRRSAEQRGKATSPYCLNRTTQPSIGLEKLGKDHFPHSATCSVCVSLRVRQKANIRAKDDTTHSNHRHPSMNPISGCSKEFFRAALISHLRNNSVVHNHSSKQTSAWEHFWATMPYITPNYVTMRRVKEWRKKSSVVNHC